MKTQPDDFAPFVEGGSIAQYCSSAIEPFKVEIEHVGMKALIDCVVLPAHIDVEIMYLDRSEGSEVNSHNFEAKEKDSEWKGEVPVIRLLYRP